MQFSKNIESIESIQPAQLTEIDQLAKSGRRWQLATAGLIAFGIVATIIGNTDIFPIFPRWLMASVYMATILYSIYMIVNVRGQLQAWARHAGTFAELAQAQADHLQTHQAMLSGIDRIVGSISALQAAGTVDEMCRLAVEMARSQLGVERCAIFLFDSDKLERVVGTYGTNMQGGTTVERDLSFSYDDLIVTILSLRRGISSAWHYRAAVDLYDTERKLIGTTWHVDTPIQGTGNKLIGVFCNDKAISKGACNQAEQQLIATFCAILGSLIEQKRAAMGELQVASGLSSILSIAEELLVAESEDEVWKLALERSREQLGVERNSIFVLDDLNDSWYGTYGTNTKGQTTDEHEQHFGRTRLPAYVKTDAQNGRRWYYESEATHTEYDEHGQPHTVGRGWIVHTPIFFSDGAFRAVMFNDATITHQRLDPRRQDLLAVYCSVLGSIVERKRMEASLQEMNTKLEQRVQRRTHQLARRAESERLVADIASQFMRADGAYIGQNIQYAIARTAEFLGVQLAKIFFLADDGRTLAEAVEWRADSGIQDERPKLVDAFYERNPWWHQQLLNDTAIQITQLSQLPPEMGDFAESARRHGVTAMVSVPLMRGKDLIGEMGFDVIGVERQWSQEDITLIRLVAETISGAMDRARIARTLQTERDLLEQRVAERTRELSALLDMSQMVNATHDLNTLLDRAVGNLQQLVPYNYALVWERIDTTELKLADAGQLNLTDEVRRVVWHYDESVDLHWKVAFEQRQPIVIENIRDGSPLAVAYCAQSKRLLGRVPRTVGAVMYVPIVSNDHVLGLIGISSSAPYALQERHAQMVMALARQIGTAIENGRLHQQQVKSAALGERNRLARELHDSVSQALFGIVLGARTLKHHLGVSKREYAETIEYLLKLSEVSLAEMRALIFELRPESLEKFGLFEAFRKQATELCNRHNLKLHIEADDQDPALPLAVKEAIYRVGMEALQNAIKHAHAQAVSVRLTTEASQVLIEVKDDGAGFDMKTMSAGAHLGLNSMRERAREYGGTVFVQSAIGGGTIVQANFPLNMVKSAFH